MALFEESILDNKTFFYYILILIGVIFAFSKISVSLSTVFGTLIAAVIIIYLYNNYKDKQEKENKTKSFQEANLLPKPEIFSNYEDLIKYLFSIQDFYIYNPEAYEEMTKNLKFFFNTYQESQDNKKQSGINHGLMVTYKRNAVNALHSIIYNLPSNDDYTKKLNKAIVTLQKILDEYLLKVEKFQKEYLYEHGYNVNSKLINKGELAYNEVDNNGSMFSYQLF